MESRLEKTREKLNKALEVYPSNYKEILRISRILDLLIYNSYYKVGTSGQSKENRRNQ